MFEKFSDTAIFKFYSYPRKKGERAFFVGDKDLAQAQLKTLKGNIYIEVIEGDKKHSFVHIIEPPELQGDDEGYEIDEIDEIYEILQEHTAAINTLIEEVKALKENKATAISGFFTELQKLMQPQRPITQPQLQGQIQGQIQGQYNSTIEDEAKRLAQNRHDAAELLRILNKIAETEPQTIEQLKAYYTQQQK